MILRVCLVFGVDFGFGVHAVPDKLGIYFNTRTMALLCIIVKYSTVHFVLHVSSVFDTRNAKILGGKETIVF